jgi:hypothetical protein
MPRERRIAREGVCQILLDGTRADISEDALVQQVDNLFGCGLGLVAHRRQ